MPSASDSARSSTGYFSCRVRNGGAIASGLAVYLSTEWHRAQLVVTKLRPRCAAGDICATAGAAVQASKPASTHAKAAKRAIIACRPRSAMSVHLLVLGAIIVQPRQGIRIGAIVSPIGGARI